MSNLDTTISLYGATQSEGSSLISPTIKKFETPDIKDKLKKRRVKQNPVIPTAHYHETPQEDNAGFIGKKHRTEDISYGHELGEFDTSDEARRAALARPYARVRSRPKPDQTQEVRNKVRKHLIENNPDLL